MLIVKNHRMNSQSTDNATITTTAAATTTVVPSVGAAAATATDTTTPVGVPPNVRKKERPLLSITVPGYVTKLEETKAGGKFLCTPCQAHCNSDIQLSQHLSSRKHMEKLSRKMSTSNGGMGEVCHVTDRSPNKGSHALKSRDLLKSLEAAEPCFVFDMNSGEARCTLCNVTLYSPQHILKHIEGETHMQERRRLKDGGEESTLALKLLLSATIEQSCAEEGQSVATTTQGGVTPPNSGTSNPTSTTTVSLTTPHPPVKKERPLLNITIPAYVTKLEDTKAGGKFLCNPCQAHCNSDIQLSQHLSSKKHADKLSGRKRSPTGIRGSWRGGRGGLMGRGRGGVSSRGGLQRMDPLAPSSAFHNSTNVGAYPHSSFAEPNISSYGSDSYGLSSLGRGAVAEYGGFGRSGGSRGGGRGGPLGRSDACARAEGEYGRGGAPAYNRPDSHSRSDYGGGNFPPGRADELNSYGRPTAEYAPRGYGSGQGVGHVSGRGMPFTYTQPLSQNFVSGGTIL